MSKPPLVSVIIPAFNAGSYIDEALRSALAQTYPKVELIVVDDASTDDTGARVAAYAPRVHCIRHARSSGSASAPRNTGMHHSRGEYICFLDADDIMLPDRIESRVAFLSAHPEVGLVFSDYRDFSPAAPAVRSHFETCPRLQQRLDGKLSLILESAEATALLAQENFGISGGFMMRRSLLQFEPGFEPTLTACEDFHFYYRLARLGPVGVINKIGMMRRLHEANMTSNPVRMLSAGIRSRTLLRNSEKNSGTREHLNRYVAECHATLARYHAEHGDYLRAIRADARAFFGDASASRLRTFCRGVARTVAIAAGLHRASAGERRMPAPHDS
jgi:glycosyltransferase involved in cell wall biosynthesis